MKSDMMKWVAAAVLVACASTVVAATAKLEAGLFSAYVWRGQIYNEDPVVQPYLTVGNDKGLSLDVWGNFLLTDENDAVSVDAEGNETKDEAKGEFSEVDLTVSYKLPLGEGAPVAVTGGIVQYSFSHPDGDTREAFVTVGAEDFPLSPSFTISYDFDEADGFYGVLSIVHEFALDEDLALSLKGTVGYADDSYNEYYFGVAGSAPNDATLSATVSYDVRENLSLSAAASYSMLLDDEIEDGAAAIYGDDAHAVFSGGVSYSF